VAGNSVRSHMTCRLP